MSEFNRNLKNRVVMPASLGVHVRAGASFDDEVLVSVRRGQIVGTATGDYWMRDGRTWIAVILPKPIRKMKFGFVPLTQVKVLSPEESRQIQDKGQQLINALVKNNLEIYKRLTAAGAVLDRLRRSNKNVSGYLSTFKKLSERLEKRNEKLRSSKILKIKEKFFSAIKKLWDAWKISMGIYGIGAVPAIVVGAVVGAGLAVTAYFIFKPDYDESKVDLHISADLERALASLDPETANKVKANLEKQIDTAYNRGRTQGTFSGMFKAGGTLLLAALGFVLATKFSNKKR